MLHVKGTTGVKKVPALSETVCHLPPAVRGRVGSENLSSVLCNSAITDLRHKQRDCVVSYSEVERQEFPVATLNAGPAEV